MGLDPRITFSRASLATYYDSAGVLKYAAHNFFLQSQTFDTYWSSQSGGTVTADATTAPNSTTTADRLNHVTVGTVVGGGVSQIVGALPTASGIFSVYAKAGSKSWLRMSRSASGVASNHAYFNLSTGVVGTLGGGMASSGIQNVGGGWYRCWIVASSFAANLLNVAEADANINCTTVGDLYLWGAQLECLTTVSTPDIYVPTTTAAVHGPRFDYDPVTHAAKGLLIEESRINGVSNVQDFTHAAWTKTGLTVTANQINAPDGTLTADQIAASASPATIGAASTSVAAYVVSVFAKKGTSDWIYLVGQDADVPRAWFNLATGMAGTVGVGFVATGIQDCGNGWYRCWIADAPGTGAEPITIGLADADNSTAVTVGRTAYIWGVQHEGGAFPSSYMPAISSTFTRAADVAVMTGSNFSSWFGSATAGTFVADFEIYAGATAGFRVAFSVENVAVTQQINLYRNSSGIARTDVAGNGSFVSNVGTLAAGVNKLGLSLATNDAAACLNGGTIVPKTSAIGMPAPTQARIGADNNASNILNGWLRRVRFFNVAKTDAELQALTALPDFAYVVFLSGFNGADAATAATDEAKGKAVTFVGNAQIDTAQFKFGTSSLLLDGTGDYVSLADHADWDFGTGQFTLEGWFRFSSTPTNAILITQWPNNFAFFFESGKLYLRVLSAGDTVQYTWAPTLNTWYHIAVDRDASNIARIYVDGVMRTKTTGYTFDLSAGATNPLVIGSLQPTFAGYDMAGWVDEIRITKGKAHYASDAGYTVPTAAFPRS